MCSAAGRISLSMLAASEGEGGKIPPGTTRGKYGEGGGNKGGRDNNAKPWQGVGRIRVRPIQRSQWIRSRREILSLRIRVRS